ncbi:MAG TPA: hypothetical protein ENH84_04395, partial [Phycisphaerae bacterium]|nr:hypothetical protein [Phycisphaerae bacterium]
MPQTFTIDEALAGQQAPVRMSIGEALSEPQRMSIDEVLASPEFPVPPGTPPPPHTIPAGLRPEAPRPPQPAMFPAPSMPLRPARADQRVGPGAPAASFEPMIAPPRDDPRSPLGRIKQMVMGGPEGETLLSDITSGRVFREGFSGQVQTEVSPIVRPEVLVEEPGFTKGVLRGVGEFTRPETLLFVAALGGITGAVRQLGLPFIEKLIAGGFSAHMIKGMYDRVPEFKEAADRGDEAKVLELAGELVIPGVFAAATALHATRGGTRLRAPLKERPIPPPTKTQGGASRIGEKDTAQVYRDTETGRWPNREPLHAGIVGKALAGKTAKNQPTIYVIGGGTASGKTTLSRRILSKDENVLLVDPDNIKLSIPEYADLKRTDPQGAAQRVHAESKWITEQLLWAGRERGLDIILDVTSSGTGKGSLIDLFKEAGYRVELSFADVSLATARARAARRAQSSLDPINKGRVVPDHVIKRTSEGAARNFFLLKDKADAVSLFDNSGDSPRLVYERVAGVGETVYDNAYFDGYKRRGNVQEIRIPRERPSDQGRGRESGRGNQPNLTETPTAEKSPAQGVTSPPPPEGFVLESKAPKPVETSGVAPAPARTGEPELAGTTLTSGFDPFAAAKSIGKLKAEILPPPRVLDPAAQRILDRIKMEVPKGPRNLWGRFYTATVDQLHPLRRAVEGLAEAKGRLPTEENAYQLARLHAGWAGKADHYLRRGTFDADTLEITGKSFQEIIKPQAQRLDEFRAYLTAKRVMEKEGQVVSPGSKPIKTGFDLGDARRTVEIYDKEPAFVTAAAELQTYQSSLLEYLQKSGFFSKEQMGRIQELNKDYVPFYRFVEGTFDRPKPATGKSKQFADLPQPIRRMKGGERPILDPLESIVKNTYAFINLADKQRVAQVLVKQAEGSPNAAAWLNKVPAGKRPTSFELGEIKKTLNEAGVDVSALNLETIATIFRPFKPQGENVIQVWEGGKRNYYEVNRELYRAMNAMDAESFIPLVKILSMPARALRLGATGVGPEFVFRNPLRDTQTAFLQSGYG